MNQYSQRQTIARLKWRSAISGGKIIVPSGPTYSTVARFGESDAIWVQSAWSLVVNFLEPPNKELIHTVEVRFLTEGPKQYLDLGSRFQLCEGHSVVAEGVVIEHRDNSNSPDTIPD